MKLCTLCHITPVEKGQSWCPNCKKEYSKNYRKENKKHIKNLMIDWRNANREHYRESKFNYYSTTKGRISHLVRSAKRRAQKSKLEFNISSEYLFLLWEKQNGKCAITHLDLIIPTSKGNGKASPYSPSIDRINPKLGYVENNVRLVCYATNCCLHNYGTEIFSVIAKAFLYGEIPETLPTLIDKQKELSYKQEQDKKYREGMNGIITTLFNSSKRGSKLNEYNFDLTKDFIKNMFDEQNYKCKLTGIRFDNKAYNVISNPFRASIDRIDPSKGYTKDNVRLVLVAVNFALNEFGEDTFKVICKSYLKQSLNSEEKNTPSL